MIINRIASAIKRQDLSQIIIEIFIVVIGIFLGLQVTDWNEEREERVQEETILNRMHTEVYDGLGYRDALSQNMIFGELQITIRDRLADIAKFFKEGTNRDHFDYRHCQAIVLSHVNNNTTITLPTMIELLSSGQISLIKSEEIKTALSGYTIASETMTTQTDVLSSLSLVLARKYPNLIELDNVTPIGIGNEFNGRHKCDYDQMAQSVAFKNDFYDNKVKQEVFVNIYLNQRQKFENIHTVLDAELSITHSEQNP
jgi:hypothetical protein